MESNKNFDFNKNEKQYLCQIDQKVKMYNKYFYEIEKKILNLK